MYFINEFPWLSLRSVLFINLWCYTSEHVRNLPIISWFEGGKARLVKESKIRCLKAFFKELGGYPFIDLNMAYLVKIPCSPWKWTFMSETQRYRKLDQKSLKKNTKNCQLPQIDTAWHLADYDFANSKVCNSNTKMCQLLFCFLRKCLIETNNGRILCYYILPLWNNLCVLKR